MINVKNKRAEFIMKDYVMIGLFLMLIIASVVFIINDIVIDDDLKEHVDVSEIEKFYDEDFQEQMNKTAKGRLSDLQDAGFFQTLFLTTLEIVQMIPRLVTMTVRSLVIITQLILGTGSEIIPSEITGIIAIMFFVGLLWAAVYFIRRMNK